VDQLAWVKLVDFPDVFPVDSFLALMMLLPDFGADFRESIEMEPSCHNMNPHSTYKLMNQLLGMKTWQDWQILLAKRVSMPLAVLGNQGLVCRLHQTLWLGGL